jgi:hypothetical protein
MTITSIKRDLPNLSIVRIETDSPLEDVILGGWLATQADSIIAANNGPFEWREDDAVLVKYPTGNINATTGREVIGNILTYVFPSFLSLASISPIFAINFDAVAHAGGGQTNATQLNVGINDIITVSTAADSVRLPNDVLSQTVVVVNLGANSVNIFPFLGDKIDNGAIDAAYALAAGSRVMFIGTNILKWSSFGLATGS